MLKRKKVIYILLFVFSIFNSNISAQNWMEDLLISPRLSFADYSNQEDWDNYSVAKTPPLAIQVEKYYNSYLSYGSFIGFKGETYKNDTIDNTFYKERTFSLATLGTFHYSDWLQRVFRNRIKFNDLDLYFALSMRLDLEWTKAKNLIKAEAEPYSNTDAELLFKIAPIAGIRYYISDKFAMLGEVGNGNLGTVTMGVSWKL